MANPSSKYIEDENARQTLANGTVLKWSRPFNVVHTINEETDLSIVYCNWAGELDYANRGFNQWQGGCASGGDLGNNPFEDYGYLHANGIIQSANMQPRIENVFTGVVLSNSASGNYIWGYNPEEASCLGNAGSSRYLLDMDINKMIFRCTINVSDKADFENIDYTDNPPSIHLPSTHNITLKELYTNPDDYYVNSVTLDQPYIYGENTSNHWRTAGVYPAHIISGETVGQFQGASGYSIFGTYQSSNGTFSYDSRGAGAHPAFGGGSSSQPVFNNMHSGYSFGNAEDIDMTPLSSYSLVGTAAISVAESKYGTDTNWNANAYCENQFFDYGDSVIWCSYGAHVYHNATTQISQYKEYIFSTRRYLKADFVLSYLASFGLYFMSESFDPDTVGLTPETLGDDSRIMIGEMAGNGTTTGRWITDIDSYNGANKNGKTSNPDYNPSGGGTVTDDEDNTDLIPVVAAPYSSGLAKYYVTTVASPILGHISTAMGAWNLKDSGKDLYKNIISCKLIKSPAPIPVSGSEPFTVYGVTLQYEGSDITLPVVSDNPTASFGSYQIPRKFNDFRDYAPYTKVEIYLPYCGWTVLPSHVVGRSVSVTYYTDIIAGTCKAVVYCNSNVIAEAAGVIGLDIPMVTENAGAKAEAVTMGLLAYGKAGLQTALGVGAAVATKGKAGVKSAVGGLENLVSAYSQTAMAFNQNYTEINGKNGDGCCIAGIAAIVIKITRPKFGANTTAPYVPAEYGHATGFVSMKSATVGSFTGLLVADNVDTSGISGATDREKQLIKLYLESGIYVNHPN